MISGTLRSIITAALIIGISGTALAQDGDDEPDPVILRMVLADTATTLQKGITAGELQGTPVSARFNMSAGDIHLSVYTATATGFIETILDPKTGNLISAKPITDTEDLAYARIEKAAMEKATVSLLIATEKAIAENHGARAISAVPQLRKGQPIARVKLQRSTDSIAVSEPLN